MLDFFERRNDATWDRFFISYPPFLWVTSAVDNLFHETLASLIVLRLQPTTGKMKRMRGFTLT